VSIPLKVMNVLLFKDEEHAKQNPSVFEIEGHGVHLSAKSAPPTTSMTASTGNGSSTRRS
jgi:hypothetical protein